MAKADEGTSFQILPAAHKYRTLSESHRSSFCFDQRRDGVNRPYLVCCAWLPCLLPPLLQNNLGDSVRTRTCDLRIINPLLYQLSYRTVMPSLGHITRCRGEVREVLLQRRRGPGSLPSLLSLISLCHCITDFWLVGANFIIRAIFFQGKAVAFGRQLHEFSMPANCRSSGNR